MTKEEHMPHKSVAATTSIAPSNPNPQIPLTARRAAVAGGAGTLIEYYDFSVYAVLAVVLGPLFFPAENPAVSVLLALGLFGAAFLARPLGGWFFGRLGDRRGRRFALVWTIVSMGACSGLIGLAPTHQMIGVAAPILLLILRLGQGFCAGGEIGGAVTYVAESAPRNKRGLYGSLTQIGATLGFSLAAAVVGLVTFLTPADQMDNWGWRIPFLISVPLTALCLWFRLQLEDTPEFEKMAENNEIVRSPLRSVIFENPRQLAKAVGLTIAQAGTGYIALGYLATFLIGTVGLDKQSVFWASAIGIAMACATYPFIGMLTDRLGRKPVMTAAFALFILLAWPMFFVLLETSNIVVATLVYFVYMAICGMIKVPIGPQLAELMPRKSRYTGVSLAYNAGTVLAGGTAPYVAAQLVESTGNSMSPAYWVIGMSVIGLVALATLQETSRHALPS
ncbi:MFS transporter [Rhodococcus opacus]|uniref:MFS transporter n=1 Tax=Rhodococcus opacus TaxID=37919 RepID=UPI002475F92D|nr:MFS transporter [Rhodococcus opacus]MDH6292843.1 MHS family proline/betaine transporter-like MFS transporter [Rhodococcus opacus]